MRHTIYYLLSACLVTLLLSCNKEEPQAVSAEFTTNIENNTLGLRDGFTVYTSETEGEFLTYFKGDSEESSWPEGFGTPFDEGTDSLVVSGYGAEGTFTFTVVATSYGNWGETVLQDVHSIDITVAAAE